MSSLTDEADSVRRALCELVRSRPEVTNDGERLDGYLRDLCPHRPAEVAVVVCAARTGIPDELLRASEGHAVEALSARLAARLHTESGIDGQFARWAVDTWALALGVGRPPPGSSGAVPSPLPSPDAAPGAVVTPEQPPVRPAPPAREPLPTAPLPREPLPTAPIPAVPRPAPSVESAPRPGERRSGLLLGGALAAVCLALIAIAVVATRHGGTTTDTGGAPTTASTSAPAPTSTAPPPTPVPPVTTAPRLFPGPLERLAPGFYTTSGFEPRFVATFPDGWTFALDQKESVEFDLTEGGSQAMTVLRPLRPLRRDATFPTTDDVRRAGATEPAPGDLVAWLRSHPRLSVSAATTTTRAGLRATQVDVTVKSGYATTYCDKKPCVALFQVDDTAFALFAGNVNRLYVLTVGDVQVLVVIEAPADKFDAFVTGADRVLETMAFPK